jgi:flagellar protein FliS
MSTNARQAYLEGEILNASPIELVQMLYRAALEAVGQSRQHLRNGEIASRSRQITRASEILNELAMAVDQEQGGTIGRNLVELYDYMQRLLMDANFRQSETPLEELERLLAVLLEAWDEVSASEQSTPAVPVELALEETPSYGSRGVTY